MRVNHPIFPLVPHRGLLALYVAVL